MQAARDGTQQPETERLARAVERFDRVLESGQPGRPLRDGTGERAVGFVGADVEDLFPVAGVLRQFPVVETPRVRRGTLDRALRIDRQREERPHACVRRVAQILRDTMPDDLEESPIAARVVDLPRYG